MLKSSIVCTLAVFSFAVMVSSAPATTISLNFASGADPAAGGTSVPYDLAPGDVAGVLPAANWNNLHLQSGSQTGLIDSSGTNQPTATVAWNSNGTYQTGTNPLTSPDFNMMHAGIDERGTGSGFASPFVATVTVTLPGTGYASYSVYAYFDAVTNNGAVVAGYNIGSQNYWTKDTASFAGTYVQATGTTEGTATSGSNFAQFTNLSGSSFTLTATPGNNNFRAELMGIQVVGVPVPEPSSALLLVMGAIGFVYWQRRRRAA